MTKVFIDGSAGTTGLKIRERLEGRTDIQLILLAEEKRKDVEARREALNSADIVFLCLPDDAARESVSLITNPSVAVIDTSTAHRTNPDWVYGFSEVVGKQAIANSKRIANPGCHASGFIALVSPLVKAGIMPKDAHLSCFSLTGYSGGGKKMIVEYEDMEMEYLYNAPRAYGLTQNHKHLKEMKAICGLDVDPVFVPVVCDFYSGMQVTVPVHASEINGTIEDVKNAYRQAYGDKIMVTYEENADENGFMSALALEEKDTMQVSVFGNEERFTLVARYDNLGKGASGSAIQNMNILLNAQEDTGLEK